MEACHEVQSSDGRRVVRFFERPDGLYSYREEIGAGDTTAYEEFPDFVPWPKLIERAGVFATLDEAIADAGDRVEWMS